MGKSIGHKIAILLAERRWRNTDLAVASGISLPTIGRWINDTHEPKARELFKVSRALVVSLDWLVDDEQDYPPPSQMKETYIPRTGVPSVPIRSPDRPDSEHLVTGQGQDAPTRTRRKR